VKIQTVAFWVETLCSLVGSYQHLEEKGFPDPIPDCTVPQPRRALSHFTQNYYLIKYYIIASSNS
jgi:hypothetical protein